MLAELDAVELAEWQAYLAISDLPSRRAELYLARLSWLAVATHSKQPGKVSDYVLKFDDEVADESPAAAADRMAAIVGAHLADASE